MSKPTSAKQPRISQKAVVLHEERADIAVEPACSITVPDSPTKAELKMAITNLKEKLSSLMEERTVVRRIEVINDELTQQLDTASRDFLWYSLALDESTDNEDTAQLLIFIRGTDNTFTITEELLSMESMKNTTTGQDLFECAVDCVEERGLSWDRMASITTHGAKSFTGKNIGMVKLSKDKLTTENPGSDILSFHCILHQESLCKSALDIKHVIEPVISVVNIIKLKALNHRQFKSLLEDMETEYEDVLYHNNVRWLSLGKVLKRVWALREEIFVFLDMKEISCEFKTKTVCEE
ncbi:general transcription factor II-I repeat domain-containing protein 2-like [Pomacea canaliculata]|uniref:general transcription factor II-I repeat domain-containing protein 2-like n=1 Tax=Pomacea canaliculata TaxID=400727 RepID=UPI000D72E6D9|nr:general transcription factor II-I repeat domain-containing protein 2-like [Pomacea canaliculata]